MEADIIMKCDNKQQMISVEINNKHYELNETVIL